MISSILRELSLTHHRVIIPNFGAFLKKDKGAASLEDAIIFSPFLRFNDGLLEDVLAKKHKITKEQAAGEILQFVQEVKQTISQDMPYFIKKFGAFYQDSRDAVQFFFAETEAEMRKKFAEIVKAEHPEDQPLAVDIEDFAPAAPTVVEKKESPKPEKEVATVEEAKIIEEIEIDEPATKKRAGKTTKQKASAAAKSAVNVDATESNERVQQLEKANAKLEEWKREIERRKEEDARKREKETEVNEEKEESVSDIAQKAKDLQKRKLGSLGASAAPEPVAKVQQPVPQPWTPEPAAKVSQPAPQPAEPTWAQEPPKVQPPVVAQTWAKEPEPAAKPAHQDADEVWEEYDAPKRKSRKISVWLLLLLVALVGAAAAIWFWPSISDTFYEFYDNVAAEETTVFDAPSEAPSSVTTTTATTKETSFVPKIEKQQNGVYYLAVGSMRSSENAVEYCEVLNRLGYYPEIVVTPDDVYVVCISRAASSAALEAEREDYAGKYGNAWILPK